MKKTHSNAIAFFECTYRCVHSRMRMFCSYIRTITFGNESLSIQQLKFYFKLVHRQLPAYFDSLVITNINLVHQHNTRASMNLFTPRVNHEFAKKGIRHCIIKTVNDTPALIKDKIHTHSLQGFSIYIKKYYWNVPCGDTSSKTLIDVCVCVCVSVRRHIAKLRQE